MKSYKLIFLGVVLFSIGVFLAFAQNEYGIKIGEESFKSFFQNDFVFFTSCFAFVVIAFIMKRDQYKKGLPL